MNQHDIYDILNKFRALETSEAAQTAADQVEKLNGVKAKLNESEMAKIRAKHDKMDESKPDFLDLDKDGNKKEPMKSAARDAKKSILNKMIP